MTGSSNEGEVAKYKSQTSYIFTDADNGEILRQYIEESHTPIPEIGSKIIIADTVAEQSENGEWETTDQDYDAMVVTDIEYEYNQVHFHGEEDSARRLMNKVWIMGVPYSIDD